MRDKTFKLIGATNHSIGERQKEDYYATDPKAIELLLDLEDFSDRPIWEPCCGQGHLSKVMEDRGLTTISTDLIDRGFGKGGINFLETTKTNLNYHIITNPPYNLAQAFIEHSLEILNKGCKIAMFLPLRYLETKGRRKLFDKYPPKTVYVSSGRINCAKNGDFINETNSAVSYAWYIWEIDWYGEPTLKWFN